MYQNENIRDITEHSTYEPDVSIDDARLIELIYVDPSLAVKIQATADV